jgi:hypothetical protein
MRKVVTSVFPSQHLRFCMIDGECDPDFGFGICRIDLDVSMQGATGSTRG